MFCFKAGVFLDELEKYSAEIYNKSLEAFNNSSKDEIIRIKHDDMINIPEDSIDYAVMEKSDIVKVIPSNISWSDVGSFDALFEELQKDKPSYKKSKDSIKEKLVDEKKDNDSTISVKAMIALRKKYNIKIKDKTVKNDYNSYIKNATTTTTTTTASSSK
jgi:mannose-1-phosphate guanylyltransferase